VSGTGPDAGAGLDLRIGATVSCSDGPGGKLARIIVDPVAREVTEIVVAPSHGRAFGHLVPVGRVADAGETVHLDMTTAELGATEDADEVHFEPVVDQRWEYGSGYVLAWPYYELGPGPGGRTSRPVVYDHIPLGEVEVRRGDPVRASDGDIGAVQGLVIDPASRHVTHVLLREGHLWGRKQVAIPITAVARADDGIEVSLTRGAIEQLPAVELRAGA
jgi:hypothetical protein